MLRAFWNRLSRRSPGVPTEVEHSLYATRYDIARAGYDMRFAQLARALDQATLKNYLSGACNLLLGAGIIMIALRGGVKPIFVPYDRFGRVIQWDDLGRRGAAPRTVIDRELTRWLVATRGIYFGDPVAQFDRGRAAKAFLTPAADQWLSQYFSVPTRNPAVLLREISRTVEVVSISKDPDRRLWYLQWREIDVPARGTPVESAWQATLTIDFVPGGTDDAVLANPTGIRISSIEWNRLRLRTGDSGPREGPDPGTGTPPVAVPAPPPGTQP